MRLWFGLLAILVVAGGHPTVSSAHGKERHFGTKINERGSASGSSEKAGAPEFTILAVRTNLNGMERALGEGRTEEARERTARLGRQILDLIARTKPLKSKAIDKAMRDVAEIASGLDDLELESEAFRAEIVRIRAQLVGVERLLPQDDG